MILTIFFNKKKEYLPNFFKKMLKSSWSINFFGHCIFVYAYLEVRIILFYLPFLMLGENELLILIVNYF